MRLRLPRFYHWLSKSATCFLIKLIPDGQYLHFDAAGGALACLSAPAEDAARSCLGRVKTECQELELREEECECPGQVLVAAADCSAFYACSSGNRVDCQGKGFALKK